MQASSSGVGASKLKMILEVQVKQFYFLQSLSTHRGHARPTPAHCRTRDQKSRKVGAGGQIAGGRPLTP